MSKTAMQLIDEKHQELLGGVDSSAKSAVEKLGEIREEISDRVSEQNQFYRLESEEDNTEFSGKNFSAFLTELAQASHQDLEIFKEMIRVADDREKLFLEIIKNEWFVKNEAGIKKFLELVLTEWLISPAQIKNNFSWGAQQSEAHFLMIRSVFSKIDLDKVVFGFGVESLTTVEEPVSPSITPNISPKVSGISQSEYESSQKTTGFSSVATQGQGGNLIQSNLSSGEEKSVVGVIPQNLSALGVGSPGQSPLLSKAGSSVKSKKRVSFDHVVKVIDNPQLNVLKGNVNNILNQYVGMRDVKTKWSLTFLRNIPHSDKLTGEKVEHANALNKGIVEANNICEVVSLLMEEKKWNQEKQKKEHTLWLRNEGEYGKHLDRCLALLVPEITIDEIKNFVRKKMPENVSNRDQTIGAIRTIDGALTAFEKCYMNSDEKKLAKSVLNNIKKAQSTNQAVVKEPASSLRR